METEALWLGSMHAFLSREIIKSCFVFLSFVSVFSFWFFASVDNVIAGCFKFCKGHLSLFRCWSYFICTLATTSCRCVHHHQLPFSSHKQSQVAVGCREGLKEQEQGGPPHWEPAESHTSRSTLMCDSQSRSDRQKNMVEFTKGSSLCCAISEQSCHRDCYAH